jgi:hypothetical protein
MTEKDAKKILDEMMDEGLIEESPMASGYYVNK